VLRQPRHLSHVSHWTFKQKYDKSSIIYFGITRIEAQRYGSLVSNNGKHLFFPPRRFNASMRFNIKAAFLMCGHISRSVVINIPVSSSQGPQFQSRQRYRRLLISSSSAAGPTVQAMPR
jgi:hypothetical protein